MVDILEDTRLLKVEYEPEFPSWNPGFNKYTPNRLRWSFFHPFHSERLPSARERVQFLPLPGTGEPGLPYFETISQTPPRPSPSFDLFACQPPALSGRNRRSHRARKYLTVDTVCRIVYVVHYMAHSS